MSSKTQEDDIKEGKLREEILNSFREIGIAKVVISILLFLIGILAEIFASIHYWHHPLSPYLLSGYGIWCSIFGIPAGIMSISTSYKVTHFSVGWSMICSVIGSFFSFLLCCLSLAGVLLVMEWRYGDLAALNFLLFVFGVALFVLCLYCTIVFTRLYLSYPYHVRSQDFLCPCFKHRSPSSFAHVMYSTIASKKHDY